MQRDVGNVRERERESGRGRGKPTESSSGACEVIDETLRIRLTAVTQAREVFAMRAWWMLLRVATRLFHLGTFQLAEVADHSLHPMHLSSSLWWVFPWKDHQIVVPNFQAAVVHSQWESSNWIYISWSHANMNHSHHCPGVDCKQSWRAI